MNRLTVFGFLMAVAHVGAHASDEGPFLLFLRDDSLVIPIKHYSRQVSPSSQQVALNTLVHRRHIRNDWPLILPRSGNNSPQKQGSGGAKTQASSRSTQQQGESSKPSLRREGSSSPANSPGKSRSGGSVTEGKLGTVSGQQPGKGRSNLPKSSQQLNKDPLLNQVNAPEKPRSPTLKEPDKSDKSKENVSSSKQGSFKLDSPEGKRLTSGHLSTTLDKSDRTPQKTTHPMHRFDSPDKRTKSAGRPLKGSDMADKLKEPDIFSTQMLSPFNSPEAKPKPTLGGDRADKLKEPDVFSTQQLSPFDSPRTKPKPTWGGDRAEKLKQPDIFSTQLLSPFGSPETKSKLALGNDVADKLKQPGLFSTQQLSPYNSPGTKPKPTWGGDMAGKLKQEHLFSTMQDLPSLRSPDRPIRPSTGNDEPDKSARLRSLQETPPRAYTPWQSPAGKKQP